MIEIFHVDLNKNPNMLLAMFDGAENTVKKLWPHDYVKVAEVDCISLDDAYRLTNHIDQNWLKNDHVKPFVDIARSSSIGDVFVCDGRRFIVNTFGFTELTELI